MFIQQVADVSDATMRAAGLRETRSRALRVPAIVATAGATALFAVALHADPTVELYGGAAGGHRGPAGPLFLIIFALLGGGAVGGGLFSRVRLHTLVWFNAASACVAGLALGLVYGVSTVDDAVHQGLWFVAGVLFVAGNWAVPFAVLQIGGALLGRLVRRGLGRLRL